MLKYRISSTYPEPRIDAVECSRETDKCVYLITPKTKRNPEGEEKALKTCSWNEFYDTWEDAHIALLSKAEKRINSIHDNLAHAIKVETAIAAMVKP